MLSNVELMIDKEVSKASIAIFAAVPVQPVRHTHRKCRWWLLPLEPVDVVPWVGSS